MKWWTTITHFTLLMRWILTRPDNDYYHDHYCHRFVVVWLLFFIANNLIFAVAVVVPRIWIFVQNTSMMLCVFMLPHCFLAFFAIQQHVKEVKTIGVCSGRDVWSPVSLFVKFPDNRVPVSYVVFIDIRHDIHAFINVKPVFFHLTQTVSFKSKIWRHWM